MENSVSLEADRIESRIGKRDGEESKNKRNVLAIWGSTQGSGMDYDNVVRATVYVSDMNNFQSMNSAYKVLTLHPPARSTLKFNCFAKEPCGIDLIATE